MLSRTRVAVGDFDPAAKVDHALFRFVAQDRTNAADRLDAGGVQIGKLTALMVSRNRVRAMNMKVEAGHAALRPLGARPIA